MKINLNDRSAVLPRLLRRNAFTLLELLFVILIIGILVALLLPALEKGRARAKRAECFNNLRQLGVAFHGFAHDHGNNFPFQVSQKEGGTLELVKAGGAMPGDFFFAYRHFQALSNELRVPKILVCPSDRRSNATHFGVLHNDNISYFAGVTAEFTKPDSLLSGDRNISDGFDAGSLVRLVPDQPATWTSGSHQFKGNILFADSRVEGLGNGGLATAIHSSGLPVNTLLPPISSPPGAFASGNPTAPAGTTVSALEQFFQTSKNPSASAITTLPVPQPNPASATVPPNVAVTQGHQPRSGTAAENSTERSTDPASPATGTDTATPAAKSAKTSAEPAEEIEGNDPLTNVLAFLTQPERCWSCWLAVLLLALLAAFFLGWTIARQRRQRLTDLSRLESLALGTAARHARS